MDALQKIQQLVADFKYIQQALKDSDDATILSLLQIGLMHLQRQAPSDKVGKLA